MENEPLLRRLAERIGRRLAPVALSHGNALQRVFSRGVAIETVIDVGASDGRWSRKVQKSLLPKAHYYLIEGFEFWRQELEKRKQICRNFDYVIAAAGERVGATYFLQRADRPTQGHAHGERIDDRYQEVRQTTIDHEVHSNGLQGPFFVKLDTHGCEGEICEGAAETLKETNLLMVEANNFGDRGRMRFHELCAFLERKGLRCADIASPTFRRRDGMFWQCDLLFLRADRPEFSSCGF